MAERLVDLSVLTENSPAEPMRMNIRRTSAERGAKLFALRAAWYGEPRRARRVLKVLRSLLGMGSFKASDFPQSAFLTLDHVTLPTHMGTHVDSPFHFGPRLDGSCGKKIHELPLEMFYGRGVRLDLRHKKNGERITGDDVEIALKQAGHELRQGDIVLIWTGADALWGTSEYFSKAPGMTREATEWLIGRGVRLMGIDTYGFDRPIPAMVADFEKTGNQQSLWPAHFLGREKEYAHIERITNLASLPPTGFKVVCFPPRIKDVDAAWIRVVAIVGDKE